MNAASRNLSILWLALVSILFLYPILNAGFYMDDALTSNLAVRARMDGTSLGDLILSLNAASFKDLGRFFPGYIVGATLFWYFCQSLWVYQVARILAVLLTLAAFMLLLREISHSTRWVPVAWLLSLAMIQFRSSNDAVLAYQFHLPLCATCIFLCVALFLRYLRNGWSFLLLASVLFYLIGLSLYEICAMIPALILPLIWIFRPEKGPDWKLLRPAFWMFGLSSVAYLGMVILARSRAETVYTGINPQLSLAFFPAYFFQLIATLPFSQFLTADPRWPVEFFAEHALPLISGFGLFFIGSIAAGSSLKALSGAGPSKRSQQGLLVVSLLLLLLPPIPMGLSQRYQKEISLQTAYLPVFLQGFGLALWIVWGLGKIQAYVAAKPGRSLRSPRALTLALAIVLGLWLSLQGSANWIVLEELNRHWRYPRENIETALSAGLLHGVPPGAILFRPKIYPFENDLWTDRLGSDRSTFYFSKTGNPFRVSPLSLVRQAGLSKNEDPSPLYFLYFDDIYAVFGHIRSIQMETGPGSGEETRLNLDALRIFRSSHSNAKGDLIIPWSSKGDQAVSLSSCGNDPDHNITWQKVSADGLLLGFEKIEVSMNLRDVDGPWRSNMVFRPFSPIQRSKVPSDIESNLESFTVGPGYFQVKGWVGRKEGSFHPKNLMLRLDGGQHHLAARIELLPRPDVAAQFSLPQMLHSGFSDRFSTLMLPQDRYLVSLALDDGKTMYVIETKRILDICCGS